MNTPQQEDMENRCATPSEMVERVARAIWCSDKLPDEAWILVKNSGGAEIWFRQARAAIEAMRVPTEAMCIAGEEAPMTYGDGHDPRDVWPRMIDAALSPAQRSSNPQQEDKEKWSR